MIADADLEMAIPEPVPTAENPFALGFRYRDGGETVLPLSREDLLWQEEGDQIVTNHYHDLDMAYLAEVLRWRVHGKPGLRVLSNHCINFQIPGLGIIGPDVVLFNGEPREWDGSRGTFPVKDMAARSLYVFEVTSPGTRSRDFRERLDQYFLAGVPGYVLIDAPYGGGRRPQGITAFQAGPDGYERLPARPDGRVWIEIAEIWIGLEEGRVACYLPDGERISDAVATYGHLAFAQQQLAEERERAVQAKAQAEEEALRAAQEKARAEEEARRAAQEKARADAAEQRIRELEAELRRLRGE